MDDDSHYAGRDRDRPSGAMPDAYDRTMGAFDGLPGVLTTKPATVQYVTPILGTSNTYIVRTVRWQDREAESSKPAAFTVFLEHSSRETGLTRLVLPPKVTELIARQRDALTGQARRRTAKRIAEERKARGEVPAFLRRKKR